MIRLPVVSILIPSHNRASCLVGYLREAIESALAQSYREIEVIVVDDGSEDETQDLLRSYGTRIRWYSHRRLCTAASLNLGARNATGRYLAFLDDDDLWHPDKLEVQVGILESSPGLGFVGCEAGFLDADNHPVTVTAPNQDTGDSCTALLDHNFLPASTGVIRRDLFDRLGGFDESLHNSHDWDLWLRASRSAGFRLVSPVLATGRLHQPHSRWKELHQKVADRVQVIQKTARAWGLRSWNIRTRVASEYYAHALALEAKGQPWTAARYVRAALRTFPFIGAASRFLPEDSSARRRLTGFLQAFRKGFSRNPFTDWSEPDSQGDLISVRPDQVTHKVATRLDWYLSAGDAPEGNWDLQTTRFADSSLYRAIVEHFRHDIPWEDTEIFRTSYAERFRKGMRGEPVRWARSLRGLTRQYRTRFDRLYRDLKRHGFVLRFDKRGTCRTEIPHVHIGREGDILLGRNGNHRLSMAKVLGLDRMCFLVRARHPNWIRIRELIGQHGPEHSWDFVDGRLRDHPDLQALLRPEAAGSVDPPDPSSGAPRR